MSASNDVTARRVELALAAHARGWVLTPLRGKEAYLTGWQKRPRPTREDVQAWATAGNVGVRTGRVSGIVLVDVDVHRGGSIPAWAETAPRVRTGRGGAHCYFAAPADQIPNSKDAVAPGVEILGDGKQGVYAGSVHPDTGVVYAWEIEPGPELPAFPDDVAATLRARKVSKGERPQLRVLPAVDRELTAYGRRAIGDEIDRVRQATEGSRNDTLNVAAFNLGQLHAGGEIPDVQDDLLAAGLEAGLPAAEAEKTIDSGWVAGAKEPRNAPPRAARVGPSTARRAPTDSASGGETYGQKTVAKAVERSAADRVEIVFTDLGGDVPLHKILPPAVAELAKRCADSVYARGDVLSRVVRAAEPGDDGIQRSGAPRIVRLPDSILKERLDEAVRWIREKKNRQGDVVRLEEWCPRPIVEAMRDRAHWPGVRPLLGVVTAPTLRLDGSILDRPGYDPKTALIYEPAREYAAVPERPTDAEVAAAYKALLAPFREFPLATPADEATVAALMLQIACRFAIAGPVPMTAVIAPEFGSGKTILARAATLAMTGFGPDEMPPVGGRRADGEAEMRKRLTTVVMESPRVAVLDNVPDGSMLESPSLAALLTIDKWTDRMLGVNRQVSLPHRVVWVATGNNIRLAGDLARRSLSILIDPGVERPSLRTFSFDLLDHVRAEHPRLLVAALTIARGFHVAGRPGHGLPALGMFTAWDAFVRAAVIWAHRLAGAEADPLDTQGRLVGEAPDRDVLSALGAAWHAELGDADVTVADAVKRAASNPDLHDAIVGVGAEHGGKLDARRLGKYLQKVAGRVVVGLVFERRGQRTGTAIWGIRPTGDGPPTGGNSVGVVGVVGVRRSPSSFLYARTGTRPRAGSDLQHSHDSHNSHGEGAVDAASIDTPPGGPDESAKGPTCPICGETDRTAGSAAGCRTCRQFLEATGARPPTSSSGTAFPADERWA